VRTNGQKNNIGRSAVFHHDLQAALFASYLICVRLDQNVANPDFVNNYLATDAGRAQMIGMASGAADGKFNINSQTIRSLLVPIPPKAKEQQEIVQLINVVSVKAGIEEQRKAALDALFKSMLYQLMAGQVRVPPADFGSRRP
jgi:type I restriction enzyme S subunit